MKVLSFGTCRSVMLFDKNINNTFINSLHCANIGYFGGINMVALTHDINQVSFLLNMIKNNRKITTSDIDYELLKLFSVNINGDVGDYQRNYLSVVPDYDINTSISNINKELNEIEYIIIEVCTLKKKVINGVPLFLDINFNVEFDTISDEEFGNDFDNFVNLVSSINSKIKIFFLSHIVKYNNEIIPDRLKTLELLKENSKKYNNCYVISPCDYISDDDLEDARHYIPERMYKMLNVIKDKIIDIESNNIINVMKYEGIFKFNLFKFLNEEQKNYYELCKNTFNNMKDNIINNNNINKIYDDNLYIYSLQNYLSEPWTLNNKNYIGFFKLMLCDIIINIAKKYLENDVYIYNPIMAVNYNCSTQRVQSQNWHRDPGGIKILKFFIFFDKTNEENGALEYIKNSQYTSIQKITSVYERNGRSIYPDLHGNDEESIKFREISNNNRFIVEAENGDCVPIDTSGFHRAGFVMPNNYRKYFHCLFLTRDSIINNTDPCDRYQDGMNFTPYYYIDIYDYENKVGDRLSKYFYKP